MKAIETDYNQKGADKILLDFANLTGIDITNKSRTNKEAYLRALLYKVLMDFNFMNDRQAASFFLTKKVKIHRSAIYHALKKIDVYYTTFLDFRSVYNIYFDDKMKESKLMEAELQAKAKEANRRVSASIKENCNDSLQRLVNSLPVDKRSEIFEMVNLRVKSWSWKSKDKCEIIESCDGFSGRAW